MLTVVLGSVIHLSVLDDRDIALSSDVSISQSCLHGLIGTCLCKYSVKSSSASSRGVIHDTFECAFISQVCVIDRFLLHFQSLGLASTNPLPPPDHLETPLTHLYVKKYLLHNVNEKPTPSHLSPWPTRQGR